MRALPRTVYRVWQFWQTLTGKLTSSQWEEIAQILAPRQIALFKKMGRAEQAHGYRVMKTLREMGHTGPDLLVAALLHDVGKIHHPLRLWERPLPVLAQLFREREDSPLEERPARGWRRRSRRNRVPSASSECPACGWRRPLVVAALHPAWGADLAAAAGASPLTEWLIRHHQSENPPPIDHPNAERFLTYLKEVDNQN